jgi:hypothetical protein
LERYNVQKALAIQEEWPFLEVFAANPSRDTDCGECSSGQIGSGQRAEMKRRAGARELRFWEKTHNCIFSADCQSRPPAEPLSSSGMKTAGNPEEWTVVV